MFKAISKFSPIALVVYLTAMTQAHAATFNETTDGSISGKTFSLDSGLNSFSGTAEFSSAPGSGSGADRFLLDIDGNTTINSIVVTYTGLEWTGQLGNLRGQITGRMTEVSVSQTFRTGLRTSSGVSQVPVSANLSRFVDRISVFQGLGRDGDFQLTVGSGGFQSSIFDPVDGSLDWLIEIDATVVSPVVVPVPATLPLLALAIGGIGVASRRKRSAA